MSTTNKYAPKKAPRKVVIIPEDTEYRDEGFQTEEPVKIGRPPKFTKARTLELAGDLREWIRRKDGAHLSEWMANHFISWQDVHDRLRLHEEFDSVWQSSKVVLEANLVRGCRGESLTRNIFLLKSSHGHRDSGEVEEIAAAAATAAMTFLEAKKAKQASVPKPCDVD